MCVDCLLFVLWFLFSLVFIIFSFVCCYFFFIDTVSYDVVKKLAHESIHCVYSDARFAPGKKNHKNMTERERVKEKKNEPILIDLSLLHLFYYNFSIDTYFNLFIRFFSSLFRLSFVQILIPKRTKFLVFKYLEVKIKGNTYIHINKTT